MGWTLGPRLTDERSGCSRETDREEGRGRREKYREEGGGRREKYEISVKRRGPLFQFFHTGDCGKRVPSVFGFRFCWENSVPRHVLRAGLLFV